jgi:hypothetical protein
MDSPPEEDIWIFQSNLRFSFEFDEFRLRSVTAISFSVFGRNLLYLATKQIHCIGKKYWGRYPLNFGPNPLDLKWRFLLNIISREREKCPHQQILRAETPCKQKYSLISS